MNSIRKWLEEPSRLQPGALKGTQASQGAWQIWLEEVAFFEFFDLFCCFVFVLIFLNYFNGFRGFPASDHVSL